MDKKKKKKKISVEEMSFLKKLFANPYRSYSKKEQKAISEYLCKLGKSK